MLHRYQQTSMQQSVDQQENKTERTKEPANKQGGLQSREINGLIHPKK